MTFVYLCTLTQGDSQFLLRRTARDYARRMGISSPELTVSRQVLGKPYFPNAPEIHFSLSHSGLYWLCAFSDSPVGSDIQLNRTLRAPRIVTRWFFAGERALVAKQGLPMFFRIWCAKEAYGKYTGKGLAFLRNNVDTAGQEDVTAQIRGVPCAFLKLPFPDYTACVCGGRGEVVLLDHREQLPENKN